MKSGIRRSFRRWSERLKFLRCPRCRSSRLEYHSGDVTTLSGVVLCAGCGQWYLVDEGVLELVPGELNWKRKKEFFTRHRARLTQLGLKPPRRRRRNAEITYKIGQGRFFDEFFEKERQDYQESPFWKAEYDVSLRPLKNGLRKGQISVDAGCGEGACSFLLYRPGRKYIGFDISRHSILAAIERTKMIEAGDDLFFFVGDVESPPIASEVADRYLLFAVLHHVRLPQRVMSEAARILKRNREVFIHDNHASRLRWMFDLLMRLSPLWEEKAAAEHCFTRQELFNIAAGSGISLTAWTSVFLPPHFFNLFSRQRALQLLEKSNRFFSRFPLLGREGGIVLATGRKVSDETH